MVGSSSTSAMRRAIGVMFKKQPLTSSHKGHDCGVHNYAVQSMLTLRSALRSLAAALVGCAGLAVAAPFAYVPDASNNVTVVDLGTRMVVATIPLGTLPARGVAVSPTGATVYVASPGNGGGAI